MQEAQQTCINGRWITLEKPTLIADVVRDLGYAAQQRGIAVAVNDHVVPRHGWSTHAVQPGDRVEVVVAVQGG